MSEEIIIHKLDRMNEKMDDLKVIAEENQRTLRGYNETPGLVACVRNNEDSIERLENKSNRNDVIVGIGTVIGSVVGFIFGDSK